jgi:hypothetical protein
MNLGNQTLESWLEHAPDDAFPPGRREDYFTRYRAVKRYLDEHVHPHASALAMLHEGGYMTDHGPGHIATVVQRVSRLVESPHCELNAREVYMLLLAIQFHDVGNIFGRLEHERRSREVIGDLNVIIGGDTAEARLVWLIAKVHGGRVADSKDTISSLPPAQPVKDEQVRVRLLAALLRFGDELAENKNRAARYLIQKELISPASLVYHRYAQVLDSVMIDHTGGTISLHFEMNEAEVVERIPKGKNEVYLLDEIFSRTLKMHYERIYCMRFLQPAVRLEEISVKIRIYSSSSWNDLEVVGYRLQESGYPLEAEEGIYAVCDSLIVPGTEDSWTGAILKERIERKLLDEEATSTTENEHG